MADIFDAGTALRVEIEIKQSVPHGDDRLFDPSVGPTVTVTDPDSVDKISAASMAKSSKGKYYYTVQTVSDWTAGFYTVRIDAGDGVSSTVKKNLKSFELR